MRSRQVLAGNDDVLITIATATDTSPLYPDCPVDVLVRNGHGLTRHSYANHPFDVVGWDGCVWPYALSIHDFEPIVGSLHQPPPVHQTFEGPGMVVCSFVPRPFDFHPDYPTSWIG